MTSINDHTIFIDSNVELVTQCFLSNCRYQPLDSRNIPLNLQGLNDLARMNCWSEIISASQAPIFTADDMFVKNSRTNVYELPVACQLRIEGLFRLKMFDELSQELSKLILAAEPLATHSPFYSDVLISMHLLLVEAKAMTGQATEALSHLKNLENVYRRLNNEDPMGRSADSLITRVKCSYINLYLRQRQWRLALTELSALLRDERGRQKTQSQYSGSTVIAEILILCVISRTLLQIGANSASEKIFQRAEALFGDSKASIDDWGNSGIWCHVTMTRGLLAFSKDHYDIAMQAFASVIEHQRTREAKLKHSISSSLFAVLSCPKPVVDLSASKESAVDFFGGLDINFSSSISIATQATDTGSVKVSLTNATVSENDQSYLLHPFMFSDAADSCLHTAINNYAVCALYLRRIKEATETLEQLIQEDPTRHICDPVVFNLCTLYEISASPELSIVKKKAIQRVAELYQLGDPLIRWQSFRLQS